MTNLSKRVEKAKKLVWSHSPRNPGHFGTWGSNGNGEQYYNVDLSHRQESITTPDGMINIMVLLVSCRKDIGTGRMCNCPGNERHTVCYHGLGALYESFKNEEWLISFFETYESALRMAFSDKIMKVQSVQGNGHLWAVIKDWPRSKILDTQTNINLMRGPEEDGID